MLLFVSTLPAFIPIPGVGGAISGPLVILIGAQLLVGRRTPWLPEFVARHGPHRHSRSEEHTSELKSLMRISSAVFCLNKKNTHKTDISMIICATHRRCS